MSASHDRTGNVTSAPTDASDGVLARRVQAGDADAYEALARKYMRSVFAVVSSILRRREDVEDAVQETFLRALERIHHYNPNRPFAPWIYQVGRNVARNRWKALKRRHFEDETAVDQYATDSLDGSPATLVERAELRRRVEAEIEKLPKRQRAAFRLRDIEGYETQEIAEMMGVSVGTVRANIHHARRALRKKLEPFARDWIR